MKMLEARKPRAERYCSFCGKQESEVFALIAGVDVMICDECVASASQFIVDKKVSMGATAVIGRIMRAGEQALGGKKAK